MTFARPCVLPALVLAAACARVPDVSECQLAAAHILWLPEGAIIKPDAAEPTAVFEGRSVYSDGSAAVTFTLTTAERRALSTAVVQHFAEAGWHQRETEYLNPGIPTSFKAGWRHECACVIQTDAQGRPIPAEPYYEWQGEWENRRGDVVRYSLSAVGVHLTGYAACIPKRTVDEATRRFASPPQVVGSDSSR